MARHQPADDDEPAIRKVQRTGGSTFTVSLPKQWALTQGLEAGSRVYVYAFEDRVVVAPTAQSPADRRLRVNVDELDPDAIRRLVRTAYEGGSDQIVVAADGGLSAAQRRAAEAAVTDLVGMQVAADSGEGVAGHSTLDASAVSLAQTVAQCRQQVLAMLREAVDALVGDDADLAAAARGRREDVDRLVALVARQFRGALVDVRAVDRLETDRATAHRQLRVARRLDDVGAAAERIDAVADEQTGPPPGALHEPLDACGDTARAAIVSALDGERDESLTAERAFRDALGSLDETLAAHEGSDCHRYGRVLEAFSSIVGTATALATIRVGEDPLD